MRTNATNEEMKLTGVYSIVHVESGKRYVGSASQSFWKRLNRHLICLRNKTHHSRLLQNYWNKYGDDAFEFRIDEVTRPEHAVGCEQVFIDFWKSANPMFGLNIAPTAGSSLGIKRSSETKEKQSAAKRGRARSAAAKVNMAAAAKLMSAETKHKMSVAQTNQSAATRAKRSLAQIGKRHSDEHKAKISSALLGRKFSNEHKTNMSTAQTDKHHRDTTKSKLAAANRGKTMSDECKSKMSAIQSTRNVIERRAATRLSNKMAKASQLLLILSNVVSNDMP